MGKIYMRTKYIKEMKMNIPHSINIANAMYGFREISARWSQILGSEDDDEEPMLEAGIYIINQSEIKSIETLE